MLGISLEFRVYYNPLLPHSPGGAFDAGMTWKTSRITGRGAAVFRLHFTPGGAMFCGTDWLYYDAFPRLCVSDIAGKHRSILSAFGTGSR